MQRAAFPELQGRPRPRRHRRQAHRDRVLIGLKIATFLAAGGLIGVVILWAGNGDGGNDLAKQQTPAVPKIVPSHPSDASPTTTPPPTMINLPALRTGTSQIVAQPPPPPPPPPTSAPTPPTQPPPPAPDPPFAVIGQPCPEPGMFYFTRDYQPAVCFSDPPDAPPRWHPVF
jgi:hypothetical protein